MENFDHPRHKVLQSIINVAKYYREDTKNSEIYKRILEEIKYPNDIQKKVPNENIYELFNSKKERKVKTHIYREMLRIMLKNIDK